MVRVLAGIAATLPDTAVEYVVRFGEPADEIAAEAEAWGAEIVAMTAARRKRFGWRRFRHVVEAVARKVRVPVLVYQVH
jgi:nucleotide-binding universal stress UspA family protein